MKTEWLITLIFVYHNTAVHINKPGAKLPYSKIREYGITVDGLSVALKHPSSYGWKTLQEILDNKDSIVLKGLYTVLVCMHIVFCNVHLCDGTSCVHAVKTLPNSQPRQATVDKRLSLLKSELLSLHV